MREGAEYQDMHPGVPGVPEGGQETVVIQQGWSQSIVIPIVEKVDFIEVISVTSESVPSLCTHEYTGIHRKIKFFFVENL